jgi:hypothetical protein
MRGVLRELDLRRRHQGLRDEEARHLAWFPRRRFLALLALPVSILAHIRSHIA